MFLFTPNVFGQVHGIDVLAITDNTWRMQTRFDEDKSGKGRYRWFVVWALHALYICSMTDRQLIGVLVSPMKRDLHLTDTQIGLIQGVGFAVLYSVVGLPLGRFIDRWSRKWIIGAGVLLWSSMTALSGLAQSVATLFAARAAVGVGEAALSPSAYSIIADLFSKNQLGRALSIYGMGSTIGGALAVLLGGSVVSLLDGRPPIVVPFIGHVFAWQFTYLVIGLPGLLLGFIFVATVREPVRRDMLRLPDGAPMEAVSLRDSLRFMRVRWYTYALLFGGHACVSLASSASAAWMPTFFMRTHGWTMERVAGMYGTVSLVFGLAGPYVAGWFADRMYAKGRVDASVSMSMWTFLGMAVVSVATPLVGSAASALFLIGLSTVLQSFLVGLPLASIQTITPNQLRGQVSAVFLFVVNIIGIGLGATSVGYLTDHVFTGPNAIGLSLALVPTVALLVGGGALALCRGHFRQSHRLIVEWST